MSNACLICLDNLNLSVASFFIPYNFNLSLAHQDRICQPLTLMQISIFLRGKLPHFYVCFSDVCEKNLLKKSNPFYSRN